MSGVNGNQALVPVSSLWLNRFHPGGPEASSTKCTTVVVLILVYVLVFLPPCSPMVLKANSKPLLDNFKPPLEADVTWLIFDMWFVCMWVSVLNRHTWPRPRLATFTVELRLLQLLATRATNVFCAERRQPAYLPPQTWQQEAWDAVLWPKLKRVTRTKGLHEALSKNKNVHKPCGCLSTWLKVFSSIFFNINLLCFSSIWKDIF